MSDVAPVFSHARSAALELPGTQLTHPFGPAWDVWKIQGKVFALLTEEAGKPMAIVKSDPLIGESLRLEFPLITPGYHMNKKHWITLVDGLPPEVIRELVTESYRLVVAKLPRRLRPIDPETFGRRR
ncbi:MmcQ/YjbR family DNA-binding protein [Corynebacterium phoceense]|uniref:MmcQ/YjbR family DNA-binding protein n=1 Tax=Corynebacterium phoceense TaxID=1686286 RepID=A0A540R891_9CORY|nr:MmcQ/YjbR family DNA-binding protein [Corynebacterium phoceense]MBF9010025.1 MmcQ/YjbR family DNA-binding protein [Corynebacterium phoceense]TQE43960.1 MmcQ/YjbR family DNA-binding protein [Corynebacterium phoceense]